MNARLYVLYLIGVGLKGVDGVVELLVGLLLWLMPGVAHHALSAAAAEAIENPTPIRLFIHDYVTSLDDRLLQTGLTLVIAFLIVHGVVKIVLVYCLLRRWHRAYPYALAVLVIFLAVQLYATVTAPTIGLVILTVLDVVIIVLVYKEWVDIRQKAGVHQKA